MLFGIHNIQDDEGIDMKHKTHEDPVLQEAGMMCTQPQGALFTV